MPASLEHKERVLAHLQVASATVEPRPRSLTPEMKLAAARVVADDLVNAGRLKPDEVDDATRDIAKHARLGIDGYELARDLDRYSYWSPYSEMVELLDGFSSCARSEIEKAEKAWAERTKPQPPLPIGTRISLRDDAAGEITGVYEYGPAKYLVKVDGDADAKPPHNSRRIINFEDARTSSPTTTPITAHEGEERRDAS